MKGSKTKMVPDVEADDAKESIEELSSIFSVANFPLFVGKGDNQSMDEEDIELDIGMYIPQIYYFRSTQSGL